MDDAKCFAVVRDSCWPNGIRCPQCRSPDIAKRGFHNQQAYCQRYCCQCCQRQFDDLTDTIFEGHHQPLRACVLCLCFMGLNLSNRQIAAELDLDQGDVQDMTTQVRNGIAVKKSQSKYPLSLVPGARLHFRQLQVLPHLSTAQCIRGWIASVMPIAMNTGSRKDHVSVRFS